MSLFKGLDQNPNGFFLRLLIPVKRVPPEPGQAALGFIAKTNTSSAFQEANAAIGGGGPPAPECADAGHYAQAVRVGAKIFGKHEVRRLTRVTLAPPAVSLI